MKFTTALPPTPDGSDKESLEFWIADVFDYTGVSFGPGGPHNSNIYCLDDYRERLASR